MIRTTVCDMFDIDHPVFLGGMGSIYSPPLVSAVSRPAGWAPWDATVSAPPR